MKLLHHFYSTIGVSPFASLTKKTVGGKTTAFTFDEANQLVSSTCDGVTTRYAYDAAGRLVKEGEKTYRYGYLDKVMSVTEGDKTCSYTYHANGQLATANYGDEGKAGGSRTAAFEEFEWDGLALIRRGDEQFMNEPHVGGGNPVVSSKGTTYFNDMLGTTVGAKKDSKYTSAALSAFGEGGLGETFFTGKPHVEGLGYAFLFRNYRAGLAKWQTADPLGYPDGWNQLAYCGNNVTGAVDLRGCENWRLYNSDDWYDNDVEDPNAFVCTKRVENFEKGVGDALSFASENGLLMRVKKGPTRKGIPRVVEGVHNVSFDGDCKHERWDSWSERYDETSYAFECLADSAVKTVSDMLSLVSGVFSALGKIGGVVKVNGKIVDSMSDIGTDTGLVALLGGLFEEHKVLFTVDFCVTTEIYKTARLHHLRSYQKE